MFVEYLTNSFGSFHLYTCGKKTNILEYSNIRILYFLPQMLLGENYQSRVTDFGSLKTFFAKPFAIFYCTPKRVDRFRS
jgi:hypothetical protein